MLMAASTSHNWTPSSSASTLHPTKWDVFLSFRGKDTRYTFTDYLYDSLKRNGIQTFRDAPNLRSGEVISSALLQAIHESKIYVLVLSENYASSQYCLDELVEILGCSESMDRLVIPVFYYIDPSVVKYQTGSFGEAFLKHEKCLDRDRLDKWLKCLDWLFLFFTTLTHRSSSTRQEVSITHESHDTRYEKGRLDRWRHALNQAGKFSGYHVRENMSQSDVINEIVDRVLHEVNPVTLDVAKYQVGLDSRVKDLETLLSNVTAAGAIKVGIYGMGGVGKTTLAKAVYNQNYRRFKGSCFLENVREASQTRKGIVRLQQKLVNDVLKCKNIFIDNADQGIELIRARICSTKILIVIDDLDSRMPLDFLEGPFALGSTIIITTRSEDLLDSIEVEAKYKVNELGDFESHQLFCQHAFGGDNRMSDAFSKMSKEILKRAGGLPLALKVCGSALFKESEEGWRCFIEKLRRVSIVDVEEILLISFYALADPMLKDVFLDIACFFVGHRKEDVVKILETFYTSVNYYIDILKKRCLLTIDSEGFMMHDLLLDMGRKIACNNSSPESGKHSRLWSSQDIYEVLEENTGTEAILGIIPSDSCLYYRKTISIFGPVSSSHFAAETFKRMSKLRFLYLKNVNLTGSFKNTFKDLRWLHWEGCSFKCLPSEFYPQKLVFLALPNSKIRTMWELNKIPRVFENLKTLDMSGSLDLTTTPDFTYLPCLETLSFKDCKRLEEIHILTGSLLRLVSLDLQYCASLICLPDSICNLKALRNLNIDGCRTLKAIPLNFGNIESLAELNAEYLRICTLPHSIGRLSKLVKLNLVYCRYLRTLPDTICNLRSLEILNICRCTNLKALPTGLGNLDSLVELEAGELTVSKLPDSIGQMRSLTYLRLSSLNLFSIAELPSSLKLLKLDDCTEMKSLPNLSNMIQLKELDLTDCCGLTEISGLEELTSIERLHLGGCNRSLLKSTFTKRFFQIYSGFGHRITIFAPSSVFPDWTCQDWISRTSNFASTVSSDLTPHVSHNFLAMILCSKHREIRYRFDYSVKTNTNVFEFTDIHSIKCVDIPSDSSCMNIVPRTIFSVTDNDDRIEFTAHPLLLEKPENAVVLGIHLLYKPEITIIDECEGATVNVYEERRHSAKRLKHL